MQNKINKRIFIVGIARSGTTLLQTMLGSHPDVYTMPETHFWDESIYKQKILRLLQVIDQKKINRVNQFLNEQTEGHKLNLHRRIWSKQKWTRYLVNAIDELALASDKSSWVEKTPLNLYYIDLISSSFPEIIFIHMIRSGADNIASLYEAGNKNPEHFAQSTVDQCISRYIKEIRISKKYIGRDNNYFVSYEKLTSAPEETLRELCRNIGLEFTDHMLDYGETAKKIIQPEENWKSKNLGSISVSDKKNKIFNRDQLRYIQSAIKNVSLSEFEI